MLRHALFVLPLLAACTPVLIECPPSVMCGGTGYCQCEPVKQIDPKAQNAELPAVYVPAPRRPSDSSSGGFSGSVGSIPTPVPSEDVPAPSEPPAVSAPVVSTPAPPAAPVTPKNPPSAPNLSLPAPKPPYVPPAPPAPKPPPEPKPKPGITIPSGILGNTTLGHGS